MNQPKMLPEWCEQDAVLITWPTEYMDWAYMLQEVEACYVRIAQTILRHEALIVLTDRKERVLSQLSEEYSHPLIVLEGVRANDTWARDYAPLSLASDNGAQKVVVDFGFNGWGMKFAANRDNLITRKLYHDFGLFSQDVVYRNALSLVCEGGALESNGRGTLLSTSSVLNEANRNPGMLLEQQEEGIKHLLGADRLLNLRVKAMSGDDTDGHIDTLARFVSEDTILYNDLPELQEDVDYQTLTELHEALRRLRDEKDQHNRLIPLPIPNPIYDREGERLPATYANFLIINEALLLPTYGVPQDALALEVLREIFPNRIVYPLDCRALVQQHGSLHCITMQFPRGFISERYIKDSDTTK